MQRTARRHETTHTHTHKLSLSLSLSHAHAHAHAHTHIDTCAISRGWQCVSRVLPWYHTHKDTEAHIGCVLDCHVCFILSFARSTHACQIHATHQLHQMHIKDMHTHTRIKYMHTHTHTHMQVCVHTFMKIHTHTHKYAKHMHTDIHMNL